MPEPIITIDNFSATCTQQGSIPINTFLDRISTCQSDILPPGCVFVNQTFNSRFLIIEQLPTIRSLTWQVTQDPEPPRDAPYELIRIRRKLGQYRTVRIALPYFYFFFVYDNAYIRKTAVYCRNAPLQSVEDRFLIPQLLNIDSQGSVCMGHPEEDDVQRWNQHSESIRSKYITPESKINQSIAFNINRFWNTTFNHDLGHSSWIYGPFRSIEEWEQLTANNPDDVLKVNWRPSSFSIASYFGDGGSIYTKSFYYLRKAFDRALDRLAGT